jgi:hypothetical protein
VEREAQAPWRNIQVVSDPSGFPIWVSGVRPGREHDTTCAKAAPGLLEALAACESDERIPTLTDLDYLNLSPAIRHTFKRPKGGKLTEAQTTYNQVIHSVHGMAERATQGDLRRPAEGQPQPDTHRRHRQGRARAAPPRIRPSPDRQRYTK